MSKVIYTKYSNERAADFALKTDIVKYDDGRKCVRKSPADKRALTHVKRMPVWRDVLRELFSSTVISPCNCQWNEEEQGVEFEFIEGISLEEKLDGFLETEQYDKLFDTIRTFFDICRNVADEKFESTEEFERVFGKIQFSKAYNSLKVSDIDMVFANIFICDDKWLLIDYEWCFDFAIPVDFILYRILHYYVYTCKSREVLIEKGIWELIGAGSKDISVFLEMERNFQKYIEGKTVAVRTLYQTMGQAAHNVVGMLVKGAPGYGINHIEVYKNFGDDFILQKKENYSVCKKEDGDREVYCLKVNVEDDLKMLRIDPVSCGCEIKVNKFQAAWDGIEENVIEIASNNGLKIAENKYIFLNNDPWFWLDIPEGKSGVIELEFEIITLADSAVKSMDILSGEIDKQKALALKYTETIEDLNRQIANLQKVLGEEQAKTISERGDKERFMREVEGLKVENSNLNEKIESIMNSLSWKATKPLRAAKDIFK